MQCCTLEWAVPSFLTEIPTGIGGLEGVLLGVTLPLIILSIAVVTNEKSANLRQGGLQVKVGHKEASCSNPTNLRIPAHKANAAFPLVCMYPKDDFFVRLNHNNRSVKAVAGKTLDPGAVLQDACSVHLDRTIKKHPQAILASYSML